MRIVVRMLAAALLLCAAAVALAPAGLGASVVERESGGRLRLVETSGTIWRGQGTLAETGGARVPLRWSLSPAALATGEFRLAIVPPSDDLTTPRGAIRVRRAAIAIRDADFEIPAAIANAFAPSPSRVTLGGLVHVTSPQFDWETPRFAGGAELTWTSARMTYASEPPVDLGTMRARIATTPDRARAEIDNDGGELGVHGDITIDGAGRGQLALALTPRRPDDARIVRALDAIGMRDGPAWRVATSFALR